MIFAEYRKLLESFKKNQISKYIQLVSTKIITLINSGHASPQIAPYFQGKVAPFTNFELEPDNISQIKKLLNALHHAHRTFTHLEGLSVVDLDHIYADIRALIGPIVQTAYEASYLATHLDIDLKELFKEELDFLLPRLAQVQQLAESHAKETRVAIKTFPLSYKVGEITGIVVDQMRPIGGDVDINFLTQFSGILPGYIQQLTQAIQQYSSKIQEHEPKLNKAKLTELQTAALNLLNDIEKTQNDGLFVSLKVINYIHIIRNITILATSTLEQVGELSESSQNVIVDKLAQFKYTVLPTLLGLTDKIEVNLMLKPGTLSTPLMAQIKPLYQTLIYLPGKVVDFKEKCPELLSVEDSRCVELRLDLAYQRIDAANKALYKIQRVKDAFHAFYTELKKPEYRKYRLSTLPDEIKAQLVEHYKIMRPYMAQLDVDFNDQIIASLLGPESWASYVASPLRWITGARSTDHVQQVLEKQLPFAALIEKNENSQVFHITLNKELIDSVHKQAELDLLPYDNKASSVYVTDESIPLHLKLNPTKFILEKSEFLALQNYFTRLNQLITRAASAQADRLSLEQLSNEDQGQLRKLYNKLHPYFTVLVPPAQQEAIVNFDHYLTAVLSKKAIEPSSTPQAPVILALMQTGQRHLETTKASWTAALYHYDLQQRKFLNAEESTIFRTAESKKLKFAKLGENTELTNADQLSAEQAIELCQWYRNKHNKFLAAHKAYNEFIALLNAQQAGDFIQLNDATKDKLRNLYHVFQPYFIAAAPAELKAEFLNKDKVLVAALSNKPVANNPILSIRSLLSDNARLQDEFTRVIQEWHHKSQTYGELAKSKFIIEAQEKPLELVPNTNPRAHHLLKDTKISEGVREFRTAMFNVLAFFNKPMQAQLTPQPSGVPFPEMENMNTQLAQSQQVRAIKDLYNSLFHLEHLTIELERLTHPQGASPRWDTKLKYVMILLNAYGHINEIKESALRLAQDPHYSIIALEVMHKAQDLYATFQEHADAYQVAPAPEIKYNPLWHILNAFYIGPKHIRALKNANYLTTDELDKLHQNAQRATLTIQGLINSSGNYFKLFLQTPKMIFLYQEMTKKLNEFTTTTHDTVLSNLEHARATLFTPMLLEADHWEDQLGFAPGSFSEPLRRIIEEYYQGLLHPLRLHSQKHLGLVCDLAPLEQRTAVVRACIDQTRQEMQQVEAYYADFKTLLGLMSQYKALPKKSANEVLENTQTNLRNHYRRILPKLAQLKLDKKFTIEESRYPEDHLFDALCNEGLKEYDPHFTEIEAWVTAAYHYSLGLTASHTMSLGGAEEKLMFLTQLKTTQEKENLQFIENYTTEAFTKHLNALCNRHIGLQYTDREYREKLEAFLLTFKAQIINTSKGAEDINAHIQQLLKAKISTFEKKHYEEYYHLDSVKVALSQFKIYFSRATNAVQEGKSSFESIATLAAKSPLINELEAITLMTKVPVQQRLEQIKAQVKNPRFERMMLTHKQVDTFSFAYLRLCIEALLEALHLYTPARKKLLNNLNNATDHPPKMNELTKKFGLFAANQTPANTPRAAEVVPIL